jgi:hypothetical protein
MKAARVRDSSASSQAMAAMSRWLVGSSSSIRSGASARSRASAARRRSPPEAGPAPVSRSRSSPSAAASTRQVSEAPILAVAKSPSVAKPREIRILFEIADAGALGQNARARIGLHKARHHLHQRGFARPVAPHRAPAGRPRCTTRSSPSKTGGPPKPRERPVIWRRGARAMGRELWGGATSVKWAKGLRRLRRRPVPRADARGISRWRGHWGLCPPPSAPPEFFARMKEKTGFPSSWRKTPAGGISRAEGVHPPRRGSPRQLPSIHSPSGQKAWKAKGEHHVMDHVRAIRVHAPGSGPRRGLRRCAARRGPRPCRPPR